MDGVEPKIVLAPICFHHFRFHGHILGAELGFKEERGALPILGTCVCHTQNPNLQLDHLTFGGMDCVFIPKSKMDIMPFPNIWSFLKARFEVKSCCSVNPNPRLVAPALGFPGSNGAGNSGPSKRIWFKK